MDIKELENNIRKEIKMIHVFYQDKNNLTPKEKYWISITSLLDIYIQKDKLGKWLQQFKNRENSLTSWQSVFNFSNKDLSFLADKYSIEKIENNPAIYLTNISHYLYRILRLDSEHRLSEEKTLKTH